MKFLAELIKLLWYEELIGTILLAAVAGAFTLVGILWLLAKLIAKLANPALGAIVTGIELAALTAGMVVKIRKAFG